MQILNVVLDCVDPERLAPFWEAATGYRRTWSNDYFIVLSPAERGQPNLLLQRVEEPKIVKNRCHVDLGAADLEAEMARLENLGATRGQAYDLGFVRWNIMADPQGNEFCITHSGPEAASASA
jgi:predicted enzyme related to lactoylglutathione lyase